MSPIWLANPALLVSWVALLLRDRGLAIVASIASLLFAAFLLFTDTNGSHYFVGSYLWYGSIVSACVGAFKLTARPATASSPDG
jgi:hypothetical protein